MKGRPDEMKGRPDEPATRLPPAISIRFSAHERELHMTAHKVVSRDEWLPARKALLAKETSPYRAVPVARSGASEGESM
jgi:hypothetical protein